MQNKIENCSGDKKDTTKAIRSNVRAPFAYNVVATEVNEGALPEQVKKNLYHLSSVYSG